MVDKAFRATFRNFATLFLLVAVVTVPLHLLYSVVFNNVIETRELHAVIETFPPARQVRSVGRSQLTYARVGFAIVTFLEIATIPFLARATRRVLDAEEEEELTSVTDALTGLRDAPPLGLDTSRMGPVLVGTATALAIGLGIERSGLLLLEFVPDAATFPFFGLMQGVSRAAGAPFLLTILAWPARTKEGVGDAPKLY